MSTAIEQPPGWGGDALTAQLQAAYENRLATFAKKRDATARLIGLDACFLKVAGGLINPQHQLSALLFLRTHAMFRSACEHGMAGQVPETFNIIRACLECAAYALHIAKTPGADVVWLKRHDDEDAMKAMKQQFTLTNVKATIGASDQAGRRVFERLYQEAIDHGAHPNEKVVTGNARIVEGSGQIEMQQIYLQGDSLAMDFAIISVARAGVCALQILHDAFPQRFDLLGVTDEMLKLRQGLAISLRDEAQFTAARD